MKPTVDLPPRRLPSLVLALVAASVLASSALPARAFFVNVGDILIANYDNWKVVRIDPNTGEQVVWGDFLQPMDLAPGVETIGELEVIEYVKRMSEGDDSILLIDSRTPDWVSKGTIPGAVNLPWIKLNPAKGADPISIGEILVNDFGAQELEGLWDFRDAKTLVMFCNGMWCGQSPNNIKNLLRFGYPAHKLKWYRGGMQDWEILGLSTSKP